MKSKIFMILLLTIVLVFGTVGITSAEGTMVYGVNTLSSKLDPGDTQGTGGIEVDQMFEGLLELEPGTTNLKPCLATSWEISEDRKEIIFHLRKGVKFHDGTDFNADAVVFSLARQYDPNHPYHQYGEWGLFIPNLPDIERVEKIDDYTVKIILKRINSAILQFFAHYTIDIVSPTNAEKYKEDAFSHPCGTGPFKFVEWVKDDHITLEANENYWREREFG